jgi:alpha-galactosidase
VQTLAETRDMVAEMLEASRVWLPQFDGKALRPAPTISTPPGTEGVSVPADPALIVAARFVELIQKAKR